MGWKRVSLVLRHAEDGMLGNEEAGQVFALWKLGWSVRRIVRELGIARNTVRAWLKAGPDRSYGGPNRVALLDAHRDWIRERWRAGVRNGDVFRQELLAMGVRVSLRTVERALPAAAGAGRERPGNVEVRDTAGQADADRLRGEVAGDRESPPEAVRVRRDAGPQPPGIRGDLLRPAPAGLDPRDRTRIPALWRRPGGAAGGQHEAPGAVPPALWEGHVPPGVPGVLPALGRAPAGLPALPRPDEGEGGERGRLRERQRPGWAGVRERHRAGSPSGQVAAGRGGRAGPRHHL